MERPASQINGNKNNEVKVQSSASEDNFMAQACRAVQPGQPGLQLHSFRRTAAATFPFVLTSSREIFRSTITGALSQEFLSSRTPLSSECQDAEQPHRGVVYLRNFHADLRTPTGFFTPLGKAIKDFFSAE